MTEPVIIVHGGSGRISSDLLESARTGVLQAASVGQGVLLDGGSCEDAAVAAVRAMEDDPTFNAGRGSCMNRDGHFEMDAAIMRSRDLRSGAVAAIPLARDPIVVAHAVMELSDHCVLVGDGARAFAGAHDVGTFGHDEVWTEKAQRRYDAARKGIAPASGQADTVGAVVLDGTGNLCAAGSTGGTLLKLPGRAGDTPLIGSGFYAHPTLGAACATGVGEAILTHVACHEVLGRIARGQDPGAAAREVCRDAAGGTEATVGLIVLCPDGRTAVAHHSEHMSWALARGAEPPAGDVRVV